MSKDRYRQQQSIEDDMVIDSQDSNEGDNQTVLFKNFLLDNLVNNVKDVLFDNIITTHLMTDGDRHRFTVEKNTIPWFCNADRRMIRGRTIFTFHFPTLGQPNSYEDFEIKSNPLFVPQDGIWHRVDEWYEYAGPNLCKYISDKVPISEVKNGQPRTRIFVNKQYERTDIVFNLDSTNRRIILTFESGHPARPYQLTQY
jgi:hypothetical protein